MGRYEKFRDKRIFRRNMIFSAVIFLSLLGTGLSVSNSVTNSLMGRENKKAIMAKFLSDDKLQFEVFGHSYIMSTKTIREDWESMRETLGNHWSAVIENIRYLPGIKR